MSTLILGAGLAGLGAALELRKAELPFRTLEASRQPGGLAQTAVTNGFSFDQAGHYLHFENARMADYFLRSTVPLERIERKAAVLVADRLIPYPFQYNLWAVDPTLRRRSLADLKGAEEQKRLALHSFADVVLGTWGETITEVLLRPYNEKLWRRRLEDLPSDCYGRYNLRVDLTLAEAGCDGPVTYRGYNALFYYPSSGRIGDLAGALAAPVAKQIQYETRVSEIDLENRVCATESGEFFSFQRLISTIPLPALLHLAGIHFSNEEMFASTQIAAVQVGFRGKMRRPYHWIYVADRDVPFYRVGFPCNINPRTCPEGCASLLIEYTLPTNGPRVGMHELASAALQHFSFQGLIEVDECLHVNEIVLSPGYVVNRSHGRKELLQLMGDLELRGILLAGRFGSWDYYSMEESFESGEAAARRIASHAEV